MPSERLRLWLERGESGFYLRDAESGEAVRWSDPRLRVVPVAGVSYRADALPDSSFDPGQRLALVREPENEHDPNAVAIWNEMTAEDFGQVDQAVNRLCVAYGIQNRRAPLQANFLR